MSKFLVSALPQIAARRPRVSLWQRIDLWLHRHNSRRHLAELDDYMLKDIGMTRVDADREALKPFWRA